MEALWRSTHIHGATFWRMEHSLAHLSLVAFGGPSHDDVIVEAAFSPTCIGSFGIICYVFELLRLACNPTLVKYSK